jgi:hypothetical protein
MALVKRNESDDKSLMLRYGRRRKTHEKTCAYRRGCGISDCYSSVGRLAPRLATRDDAGTVGVVRGTGLPRTGTVAISVASIATTVMIAISGFAGKREVAAT